MKAKISYCYADYAGPEIRVDLYFALLTCKTEMLVPVKHWRHHVFNHTPVEKPPISEGVSDWPIVIISTLPNSLTHDRE